MPPPLPRTESAPVAPPASGTVPLGPDEPELFTDALRRIVRRLEELPAGQPGQAT